MCRQAEAPKPPVAFPESGHKRVLIMERVDSLSSFFSGLHLGPTRGADLLAQIDEVSTWHQDPLTYHLAMLFHDVHM